MERFVNTTNNRKSGESIEMIQLAGAMDGKVVHHVPHQGLLVYMINLNLRPGAQDFKAMAARRIGGGGINVILIGTIRGWDELEKWRPYFDVLKQIADVFFVHHPEQAKYLAEYGINAVLKPINEESYLGKERYEPNTVLYTGFLWNEKDLSVFLEVADLLPKWRFTIQVGQDMAVKETLPPNCSFNGKFIPQEKYLEYLAGFEYIWIPRKPTELLYPGRSGLSAVASGRPAILTDVTPNDIVPEDVAIKYPHTWKPKQIAELIQLKPTVDEKKLGLFLNTITPGKVWGFMKEELAKKNLAGF